MNTYTVAINDPSTGSRTYTVRDQAALEAIKDAFYQAYGSSPLKTDTNVISVTLTKLNTVG